MNEQVLATPVADSTLHPLEQLAATNPDAEIWWDSSPLIYPSWKQETLAKAIAEQHRGSVRLANRVSAGEKVDGLVAELRLPLD